MRLGRVEDLLELLLVLDEEVIKALEYGKMGHAIDLFVSFSPFEVTKPIGWVLHNVYCSSWTSEIVSPLICINKMASE